MPFPPQGNYRTVNTKTVFTLVAQDEETVAALSLCSGQDVHGVVFSGDRWAVIPFRFRITLCLQHLGAPAPEPAPQEDDV